MSNPHVFVFKGTQAYMSREISYLAAVANPSKPNLANTGQDINHWRIFAVIDQQNSVIFDMSVGGDGQTGLLVVQQTGDDLATIALVTVRAAVRQGLTVQELLDSITDNKLERYRFTGNGVGCRNWIRKIIQSWESEKLVERGAAAALDEVILFVWTSETTKEASAPEEGTFIE